MTITSSPPIRNSPIETTLFSGLNVRLASLYGSVMRRTSCTPSSTSSNRGSATRLPPTAPITVRSAPVDRCTSNPISTSCEITRWTWSSVARSCITTTIFTSLIFSEGLRPPDSLHALSRSASSTRFAAARTATARPRRSLGAGGPSAWLTCCARSRLSTYSLATMWHRGCLTVRYAARQSVITLCRLFIRVRDPFEPSCFFDDSFEQPLHRLVVQRARIDPLNVTEDVRLARRLIDLEADQFLLVTDRERARGAFAQELDEPRVEVVDLLTKLVDPLYTALFSHRTYSPARSATSGAAPCSAITFTSALPTTAASADWQALATCSGDEIPNPTATGSDDCAFTRATSSVTSSARRSRTPVTPRREITYRNPRPSSPDFRIRPSVVVGLMRKIGSRPAATSGARSGPASSTG